MDFEYYLEPPVTYKEGEIVWVKLGPTWWPGEVKDLNNLPPEVEFKKPPLAAVQFFDEDSYEYVRSWDHICPYNCDKKVEFIKKGMASFRANVPHMQKFPKDVSNAEVRVGGNPNILSDPVFAPEKRRNASDDETPSSKGKKEKRLKIDKSRITHRRFLGFDDYKAYICIQYPEKDRIPGDREDDEVILLNREPEKEYKCYSCCFTTKRLEVLIVHTKFHISGLIGSKIKKKKRAGITKAKKEKSKKPRLSSNLNTSRKKTNSESTKRRKIKSLPNTNVSVEVDENKEAENFTDIRSHLLAEWDDSDDGMDDSFSTQVEFTDTSISKNTCDKESGVSSQNKDHSDISSKEDSLTNPPDTSYSSDLPEDNVETNDKISTVDQDTQQAIKSCFDFDEEDEEEGPVIIPTAVTGRKIPRVIPISEKRRSSESASKENPPEAEENSSKENDVIDKAFHDVMEATSIPELPDISSSLKWEQNFHGSKTIKFPDKGSEESDDKSVKVESLEATTKLINPKKRFVKSFKDFEHKQNMKLHREKKNEPEDASDDFLKLKSRILSKIIQQAKIGEESKMKIMSKIEKNNDGLQDSCNTTSVDEEKNTDNRQVADDEQSENNDVGDGIHSDIKPTSENVIANSTLEKPRSTENNSSSAVPDAPHVQEKRNTEDVSGIVTELLPPKKKLSRRTSHPKKDRTLLERFEMAQAMQTNSDDNTFEVNAGVDETKHTAMTSNANKNEPNVNEDVDCSAIAKSGSVEDVRSLPQKNRNEEDTGVLTPDESKRIEKNLYSTPVKEQFDFFNHQSQTTEQETLESAGFSPPSEPDPNIGAERNREGFFEKRKSPEKSPDAEMTSEPIDICSSNEKAGDSKNANDVENESVSSNSEKAFCETLLETPIMGTPCVIQSLLAAEKEEYDSVGKASIYLPDDAICSPPRKRKPSENCSISGVDDTLDAHPLMKKVKKDAPKNVSQISEDALTEKMECETMSKTDVLLEEIVTECVSNLVTKVCESVVVGSGVETFEKEVNNFSDVPLLAHEANVIADQVELGASPKLRSDEGKTEAILNDKKTEARLPEISATDSILEHPQQNLGSDIANAVDKEEIVTEEIIYFDEEVPLIENVVESTESPLKTSNHVLPSAKDSLLENKVGDVKIDETSDLGETTSNQEPTHRLVEDQEYVEVKSSKIKEVTLGDAEVNMSESIKPAHLSNNESEFLKTDNGNCPLKEMDSEQSKLNQVEVHCIENSLDGFKFSIQTDLSNLSDSKDIMMDLTTLTEIKSGRSSDSESNTSSMEQNKNQQEMYSFKEQSFSQSELVPVEGNLTVVSEKDLADGQVEITPEQVISSKKVSSPTTFFTDFSDSTNDSSSTTDTLSDGSKGFESRGTEFSSRAIMKEVKSTIGNRKSSAYGRTELLDILEGNSDTERKIKEPLAPQKSVMDDFCDFEDHIPSQIVCARKLKQEKDELLKEIKEKETITKTKKNYKIASTTTKLFERLSETKKDVPKTFKNEKPDILAKQVTKAVKPSFSSKPIILSEQIIKLGNNTQITKPKNMLEDIEDVEAFVIHKDIKKLKPDDEEVQPADKRRVVEKKPAKTNKQTGKAKILQQTIITASGEIIQPAVTTVQTDENVFDINSMPIVLSDQILTPENIEKMSIVMPSADPQTSGGDKIPVTAGKMSIGSKLTTKTVSAGAATADGLLKPLANQIPKSKTPRILQTSSNRVIQKGSPLLSTTSKPGKYILVPQGTTLPATKGVVKKMVLKKASVPQGKVLPASTPEMGGNKIMIVTNQQGQQQRLLLTPAQQKLLGCQTTSSKVTKTIKGNIVQSSVALPKRMVPVSSTETTVSLGGQTLLLTNSPGVSEQQIITPTTNRIFKTVNKKIQFAQKSNPIAGKGQTILIKNQQTPRKVQGTDEELDKQVAEQLEAIKASSGLKFESQQTRTVVEPAKTFQKTVAKRLCVKKTEPKTNALSNALEPKTNDIVPLLTTKNPVVKETAVAPKVPEPKVQPKRPLNQLVIQDSMGIQTTITEGQIFALPSETVDGHPQSYMLVTLDKSGNLIPLNNEALMSLDPNLGSCGDISNMVLQIEQSSLTNSEAQHSNLVQGTPAIKLNTESGIVLQPTAGVKHNTNSVESADFSQLLKPKATNILPSNQAVEQPSLQPISHEQGQQLIISGDPVATQKFLESLTEGTTDLANLLANADGNSILIQADGQQILINAESDNQMLLSVNNDNTNTHENSESGGNPIFASQPSKSQDILAAALADTDVFQQDQHSSPTKFTSQLSPGNSLYPMNVGNVLETSLTLNSPIMTPLEVPSTNNKKIPDDETDILTQVPKNVDLPITITDPNISQTVSNQHVASLIANELQANLELNLSLPETAMTTVSKHLHSPSYAYSLPALDDPVEISHKTFSSSMPLLNEDADESTAAMNRALLDEIADKNHSSEQKDEFPIVTSESNKTDDIMNRRNSFLEDDGEEEEEEGRFTLGREMCSSLSEPPPEMFDLAQVNSSFAKAGVPSLQSTPDPSERAKDEETTDLSTQGESSNDGSCEIPVQPKIIAKSQNLDLLNSD